MIPIKAGATAILETADRGQVRAEVMHVERNLGSPWWDEIELLFHGRNKDLNWHEKRRRVYRCAFERAFRGWA